MFDVVFYGIVFNFTSLLVCLCKFSFLIALEEGSPVAGHVNLVCCCVVLMLFRGRNNSKMSGCQQDYLAGKSGSSKRYLIVWKWLRLTENIMTDTKIENVPKSCGNPLDYCCHHL